MKWPHFTDKKTEAQRFETTDPKIDPISHIVSSTAYPSSFSFWEKLFKCVQPNPQVLGVVSPA